MQLSPEIPQDIIDNIIGELTGDSDSETLKRCATVSRSFLHPSRRSLFAAIRFHTKGQTERLHNLLTSVPEISLYIHELSFAIYNVRDPEAWVRNDKTLAGVLRMLPGLRVLPWGTRNSWRLNWDDDFSNELRSALLDLFRSPGLATVTISNLEYLPLSIFSAFTHVKELSLLYVKLKGTSAFFPFQLSQLEVLIIAVQITLEDAELFTPTSSSFPNLSLLSTNSASDGNSLLNKRIIQSSTRSIERLIWNLWGQSLDIDLGIIENLRVITFTLTDFGFSGWMLVFYSLLEHLKNQSITKSLKRLSIGFLFHRQKSRTLPNFEGWKDLDTILSSLRILQVLIVVDFTAEVTSTSRLQSVMKGQLPLLESCGTLSIVSGSIRDLGGAF